MAKRPSVHTFEALPVDHPSRRRLPPLLRRAWYSMNQTFNRRLTSLGLTPNQFTVLRWLTEGPEEGLTQRELADLMASDPNTISGIVHRMEESDLVERIVHEADRRAYRVRLTATGRRAYATARPVAADLQEEILAALPEAERETFLHMLETVADAARSALLKDEREVLA